MKKTNLKRIVAAAIIAAAYAGLTYISAAFGIAYGPVQFRISEALTILPLFTPVAIPGLTVGCFLANLMSYNPIDLIFGTSATRIASLLTYYLRKVKIKRFPLLSFICPIIVNALIVGFEIAFFFVKTDAVFLTFLISSLEVALGEAVVIFLLGTPFYYTLNVHKKELSKWI